MPAPATNVTRRCGQPVFRSTVRTTLLGSVLYLLDIYCNTFGNTEHEHSRTPTPAQCSPTAVSPLPPPPLPQAPRRTPASRPACHLCPPPHRLHAVPRPLGPPVTSASPPPSPRLHAVPRPLGAGGDEVSQGGLPSGAARALSPPAVPAGQQLLGGGAQLEAHIRRAEERTGGQNNRRKMASGS